MWNKSKSSSEEIFEFLLQDLWNNNSNKTCGCKSHAYYKEFDKEVNNLLKEREERQPSKKRANLSSGSIFKFFL
jgi:hypothetical protein